MFKKKRNLALVPGLLVTFHENNTKYLPAHFLEINRLHVVRTPARRVKAMFRVRIFIIGKGGREHAVAWK